MPLKLSSSGGGSVTLDTPSTASTFTLTVPAITGTAVVTGSSATVSQTMLAAGVAGTGPAFSAYRNTSQSISNNTWTKIQINTEEYDTGSCFDPSTNYRFTPNVAGYYLFTFGLLMNSTSNDVMELASSEVYKNGSAITVSTSRGGYTPYAPISKFRDAGVSGSVMLYMNGTTDYVELYGRVVGGGTLSVGQASFQGTLVRAA